MRMDNICWQSVERSELPKALFGKRPNGARTWELPEALNTGQGVALGYAELQEKDLYCPPALIVLEDRAAAEVLSWMRTYAPETFPLNQFARVVLYSDWERMGKSHDWEGHTKPRGDRWASVVFGELLAQGDLDLDIANIPLSWHISCFSTAIAKSAIVHSSERATHTCLERLLALETDERFPRRSVSIDGLRPIWALAESCDADVYEIPEVVEIVLRGLNKLSDTSSAAHGLVKTLLSPQFLSNSVEGRVIAFQHLAAEILNESEHAGGTGPLAFVSIAAGAFLVGRGTSHAFLINRLGRKWARAHAWFGLMAGLAGPQSWDSIWSLPTKGIEKSLRGPFNWLGGGGGADLSWAEYSWASRTFRGKDIFLELPKSLTKMLTVEIVPGATCQLRLAAESSPSREMNKQGNAELERSDLELKDTLEQLAALITRARHLVAPRATPQMQFNLDDPDAERLTSRRRKKPQN